MLNQTEIEKLIRENKLIEDYIDLATQLTPNGIDLTCGGIFKFGSSGALDLSNKERKLPVGKEILPKKKNSKDRFGWWKLDPGTYKIKTNETVNLPNDLIALAFSRTSLLRMGAFTQHGVWDAGFHGKGEFVLVVGNPDGISIKENARIAQLVFMAINKAAKGYNGIYQNLE